MSTIAVVLILISAAMHATWNMLAKRATDPLAFLYNISAAGLVVYAVPVAWLLLRDGIPTRSLPFMFASGMTHVAYFSFLAAAYRNGALSLTYPIARGTGVVLVPFLAIPLLDERPTVIAWLGIATILIGFLAVAVLGARSRIARELRDGSRGIMFALLTGLTISTYSIIDKAGVQHAQPLVYVYGIIAVMLVLISPWMLTQRRVQIVGSWRDNRGLTMLGGAFQIGTYLLVLSAMALTGSKIGYIVPLRETSIVFAAVLGVLFLKEKMGPGRIAGVVLIVAGVLAIAFGG